MATKTFKVALSLDNPRIIQSGIDVRSFDKQSIKIEIELTKNSQTYQIPTGAQIKISLLKLARQEQKIILDVPFTSAEAIEWLVPDYLDGYQGEVRVGVYLIVGTENIDVGYFNISSKVSDIDKAAEEFTESVMQGWDHIEADLAEIRATITQVNTLASDFTADVATKQSDVTSKYNAFDTSVTQAGQTIDDILALQPQFQSVLDETTGKDVISAPEIILGRGAYPTLGERLDSEKAEVTAQLARTEGRLDTILVNGTPTEGNTVLLDGAISATGENLGSVGTNIRKTQTGELLLDKAVSPKKTDFLIRDSLNVFDKTKATDNTAIFSNGTTYQNPNFATTDYIKGIEGDTLEINLNGAPAFAAYDDNKNPIGGSNAVAGNPKITYPTGSSYVRWQVDKTQKSLNEVIIVKNTKMPSEYVPYHQYKIDASIKVEKESLPKDLIEDLSSEPDAIIDLLTDKLLQQLNNPFVKTKIKLIGDSITSGEGGSGFSATGETIFGNYKANVLSANCWANSTVKHITNKFNKEHYIGLNDPNIEYTGKPIKRDNNAYLQWSGQIGGNVTSSGEKIKFRFFGDHLAIIHAKTANSGILDIFVDGVKVGALDGYGASASYGNEKNVTGLSLSYHDVEIVETGTRNASSGGYYVYVEALKIPKTAIVKNWGISGINSSFLPDNQTSLVSSDDDIVIVQVGTNDRHNHATPATGKIHIREFVKYVRSLGSDVVIMSANAVSPANDNDTMRKFKMNDVDQRARELSQEQGTIFISNYRATLQYVIDTGININDILSDGLHLNDLGHQVLFENVISGLGLSILGEGVTY